jgi:hypothetical protein
MIDRRCRELLKKETRLDRKAASASLVAYHSGAGRSRLGRRTKLMEIGARRGRGRYMRSDRTLQMLVSRRWTVLVEWQSSPRCSSVQKALETITEQ